MGQLRAGAGALRLAPHERQANVGAADQTRLADDYLARIERGDVKGARA